MVRPKKIVVIGGVAGGMSAATRMRRLDERADIVVLERSGYVSFANCGLPYHLSGTIEQRSSLMLQTPASLAARFALDVRVKSEAVEINRDAKTVIVRNLETNNEYVESYDFLVLSPGAAPVMPGQPGAERAMSIVMLVRIVGLEEVRVDVELGIEVEAAQIEHQIGRAHV